MNKKCSNCKDFKDLSCFYKDKSSKDGLSYHCKDCVKKRASSWRRNNLEKDKETKKNYYKNNKELIIGNVKRWQESNPEKVKRSKIKNYKKNKERYNKASIKWNRDNCDLRKKVASDSFKKSVNNLSDSYIKNLICSKSSVLKRADIPEELVKLKRIEILIKREVRK